MYTCCHIDGRLYPRFQFCTPPCQSPTYIWASSAFFPHFFLSVSLYGATWLTFLLQLLSIIHSFSQTSLLSSSSVLFKLTLIISPWESHKHVKFKEFKPYSFPSSPKSAPSCLKNRRGKEMLIPFLLYPLLLIVLFFLDYIAFRDNQFIFPRNNPFCPRRRTTFSSSKSDVKLVLICVWSSKAIVPETLIQPLSPESAMQ